MRSPTTILDCAYRRPSVEAHVDLLLDANEGGQPAPELLEVLTGIDPEVLRRYPDTGPLERQWANALDVAADRLVVCAGADDAIDRACRVAFAAGGELVLPVPTFEMMERYARAAGAVVREVVVEQGVDPVASIVPFIGENTRMVAVVSPNNPTGSVLGMEALRQLSRACGDAILLVDLAYDEFADESSMAIATALPNTIVLRTLSKAYGLAGIRVGAAIAAPDLAASLRAAGGPYAVSGVSITVAQAALAQDDGVLRRAVSSLRTTRQRLGDVLEECGADPAPSQGNFILCRPGDAEEFARRLRSLGIAVRRWPDSPLLGDRVRITCPMDASEADRLLTSVRSALRPAALLLDMDGVIADESQSYREAILATVRSYGVEVTRKSVEEYKARGGANDDWRLTQEILEDAGVEVGFDAVVARFEEFYQGAAGVPGLRELERPIVDRSCLEALAGRLPLAIVTGRPRRDAKRFLERFGLSDLFATVVTRDDTALPKPDPQPVRLALDRLGVRSAWMVGDTPDDVRAARGACVLPIGVLPPGAESGRAGRALLECGAYRVLPSLNYLKEIL